ncbi:MAG: MarR family transcriptional regulator [Spirochaetaceae bacterium]|jgi:DNA-binding MarR family transcriptional regulator|nr:MarR family transcriptional regulator [Spirochaetaceae bacterium]
MVTMEALITKLYRPINLMIGEMETPWLYGVEFPLHHAEVHMLETIKVYEGANVGELARRLGMTSGAVSQVTKKLLDKGLIEAYKKPGNRKEVFSRLTALGEQVCEGHLKHHENMLAVLREFISRLDEKEAQGICDFLDALSEGIEGVIDQAGKRAPKSHEAKSRH